MFPLDEVDVPPVAVRQPAPPYPAAARRMKQEGMVLFELLIDEEGRVIETRQTGGDAGRVLVNAALEAGAQWTFRPAMKDGVPVRVWKPAQVEFRP